MRGSVRPVTASERVWIGHTQAGDWEHDEETGGLVAFLRADDGVQAGLWRPGPRAGESIELVLEADETLVVLAGSGTVEADGGSPLALEPGVMVSFRPGTRTRWVVDDAFLEFWVYSRPPRSPG